MMNDYDYRYEGEERTEYSPIPEDPIYQPGKRGGEKKGVLAWIGKVVVSALLFGLIAGGTMAGINTVSNHFASKDHVETTVEEDQKEESSQTETGAASNTGNSQVVTQDISEVVDSVMPSVVSITGKFQTQSFFGTQQSEGAGSGFIIAKTDDELMIATNNHVVADSTELTVGFIDGKTAKASIEGVDSSADLAVISVKLADLEKDTLSKVKAATLGSSDNLKVGQTVIAIGNALGYGQSVTTGVISAKDRELNFTDGNMGLLQTDAAINPGNSGGVLIDTSGKVIGINNAKLADTSVEGMCYAIPISTANTILNKLMNAEQVDEKNAAFLGVRGKDITSQYSQALGMPTGIYVASVVEGSPAEKAGIKVGDVITKLDGNNVSSMKGLIEKLAYSKAGDKAKVTVKRANQSGEYKEKEYTVTLGKKSDFKDASETTENNNQDGNFPNNGQNGNGNNEIDPYGNDNGNNYDYGNGSGNGQPVDPFDFFFNY